ncbi:MAG: hypothetical protein WKF82_06435 [Nocardioidaceae bacterium]
MLRLRPRRSVGRSDAVETINLDEALFVPALIMLAPWQTYAVMAAASVASSVWTRRGIVKTAFNLGQLLIAATAGILVVRALGFYPAQEPTFRMTLGGMLGALVMTLTSALIVRGMVSYATRRILRSISQRARGEARSWLGAITLGGLGVLGLASSDSLSVILVIGVAMFVHRAYAASVTEVHARRQAEHLQRAVVSLRTQTEPDLVRADLLAITQRSCWARVRQRLCPPTPSTHPKRSAPPSPPTSVSASISAEAQRPGMSETRRSCSRLPALPATFCAPPTSSRAFAPSPTRRAKASSQSTERPRITFANPAACQMLACSQEADVMRIPIQDAFHLRQRRVLIDFKRMVDDQVITQDAEGTLGTSDGDTSRHRLQHHPLALRRHPRRSGARAA